MEIRCSAGGLFGLLVEALPKGLEFAPAVYSGCVFAGGLLAGFVEIGAGLIERRLELLGAAAVLGGLGGGDVNERLEVRRRSRGGVGVLSELGFERGDALGGLLSSARRVVPCGGRSRRWPRWLDPRLRGRQLCLVKLRLELGDPVARTLCLVGRGGMCLLEFGLELLGAAAVLGGLGG